MFLYTAHTHDTRHTYGALLRWALTAAVAAGGFAYILGHLVTVVSN
jgi:hypothetical protein